MSDWMEELERLAKLRDNGVISSDEFESLKRELVPDTTPPEEQTEISQQDPLVRELERVADLHEKGILSDQEYSEMKASILGIEPEPDPEQGVDNDFGDYDENDGAEREPSQVSVRTGKGRKSLAVLLLLTGIGVGVFFLFSGGGGEDTDDETALEESRSEFADVSSESDQSEGDGGNDAPVGAQPSDRDETSSDEQRNDRSEDSMGSDEEVIRNDYALKKSVGEAYILCPKYNMGGLDTNGNNHSDFTSLPLWIAQQEGYFSEANIEVICRSNAGQGFFNNQLVPQALLDMQSFNLDLIYSPDRYSYCRPDYMELCDEQIQIRKVFNDPLQRETILISSELEIENSIGMSDLIATEGCTRVAVPPFYLESFLQNSELSIECFSTQGRPQFGTDGYRAPGSFISVSYGLASLRDAAYFEAKGFARTVQSVDSEFWQILALNYLEEEPAFMGYVTNRNNPLITDEWICAFNSAMNRAVQFIAEPSNDERTIEIASGVVDYSDRLGGDKELENLILELQLEKFRQLYFETPINCEES